MVRFRRNPSLRRDGKKACSAPSEEAVGFLGYVGDLCFEHTEPVNVPARVEQNVTTDGQLLMDGAELTLGAARGGGREEP